MNKKIVGIAFVLAASFVLAAIAPASANNSNVPEGVKWTYLTEGVGTVETPGWPVPKLIIYASKLIGSFGCGDGLLISVPYQMPDGSWTAIPFFYFNNNPNPDAVPWVRMICGGFPVAYADNCRHVSGCVLKVERHVNCITAELKTPQIVWWVTPTGQVFPGVIPTFTMKVDKVGCAVYTHTVTTYTGYPGASGYTQYYWGMGFNAKAVFCSPGWNSEMSDYFFTTNGISKYVPPG